MTGFEPAASCSQSRRATNCATPRYEIVVLPGRVLPNVIPGQIKNNLDFRVCGRADDTLSSIILGNNSADDQIPKDARGRFILQDGTVFQGYLFDEGRL